jgi:GT2 family glycosyltransferase
MKVRELIKDTVWLPGRDYERARPLVSVLMPTFRRGQDGMFVKAATSVLDQLLRELELIIVDDGSSDGTANQITALMEADGRVSRLRHPENIGLPAISEFEAFQRARGEYIAFGFDDFIFVRNALAELLALATASPRSVVHGYVESFDEDGNQHFLGKDPVPHERLRFFNFLANASFLVPRFILNEVGLFDPHVAATRLCDWDLWLRILQRYPIHRAPVFVGAEYGGKRKDSLGNTYPLLEETLQEYFASDRNQLLRPENFPEFDVWRMPEKASFLLSTQVATARRFFKSHDWTKNLRPVDTSGQLSDTLTIGVYGASVPSLRFEDLPQSRRGNFLYIHPDLSDGQLAWYLAACGVVIMAGDVLDSRSGRAMSMCEMMNIPLYLLDENPIPASRLHDAQPADGVAWAGRMRKLVEQTTLQATRERERTKAELSVVRERLAAAETELASRSYRLALQIRNLANAGRRLAGRLAKSGAP